ncbi:MAG: hypothetical protein U9R21_05720 [Candidatus Thermoplasmatota archaeon]|nr:hypothetical protein [Candidatus Thermoplasmatota archaeon]
MPICDVCRKKFHPDYMLEKKFRGDNIKICAFCEADRQVLTITNEDGTIDRTVRKEEESRKYVKYLYDLSNQDRISEILTKGKPK